MTTLAWSWKKEKLKTTMRKSSKKRRVRLNLPSVLLKIREIKTRKDRLRIRVASVRRRGLNPTIATL